MLSVAVTVLCWTPVVFLLVYVMLNYLVAARKSVCVVVLGDIGRSPRMQYHSLSFLKAGFSVDLVGYRGSDIQSGLKNQEQVTVHYLTEPAGLITALPRLLGYVLKVLWQSCSLAFTLLLMPKCGYILLQNPPCIPALAVALAVCWLRRSFLVVDWHNYGYTILGLTLGNNHLLVRFSKWYERFFGKFAAANICVTEAMRCDLKQNWNISASVMYDRPPAMFREVGLGEQHELFTRLSAEYPAFKHYESDDSAFTRKSPGQAVTYRPGRPALLVSSTSWTEDEDFAVLLEALEDYEQVKKSTNKSDLPDLVCAITGKGPLKEFYSGKIAEKTWKHVQFCLPWLTPQDYPLLLGSADLGVCLHKSSSGLDLPMKVVDMFGCGLPVCAIDFNCLHELVQHDVNGQIFSSSKQLSTQIQTHLKDFPDTQTKLHSFRENLQSFQAQRWQPCWEKTVLPLFQAEVAEDKKSR